MRKEHRRLSIINLIAGYSLAAGFIILMMLHLPEIDSIEIVPETDSAGTVDSNTTFTKEIIVYNNHTSLPRVDYVDRLNGVVNRDTRNVITATVRDLEQPRESIINRIDDTFSTDNTGNSHDVRERDTRRNIRDRHVAGSRNRSDSRNSYNNVDISDDLALDLTTDSGLLDRRLSQIEEETTASNEIDLGGLTVDRSDEDELGEVTGFMKESVSTNGKYDAGKGGQLYAYSYPSQGVGAGVGTSGLGAAGGFGAGIGAGVGDGVSSGNTVPTLGGIGTYTTPGTPGSPAGPGSGAGGLVAGSGAGGAAGLYTGRVIDVLGIGPGGPGGESGGYNYDHLPKDGALHIMIHVDGSGSILNTRKQLDIMRDTLLKDALLPYYNNDIELYDSRVTIISTSGERTLQFFEEAAKKDNVLAIAFQDEAQPAYHLPNFNKKPEEHYIDDMTNLKASLNGYGGLYRGVMFQVDRGKTFAKSFKEFVNNSFRGEGYLESNSLKKYYRDNNIDNIRNKNGIVFSDEYHAKDSGDPSYYLNLILSAASRVGLDLKTNNGGLTDGKHIY